MKVGDYVRFYDRNWTEIGKIVGEVEDSHLKVVECRDGYYDLDNFIKSSSNIIDLIEVGDYVNGYKVRDINNVAGFVIVNTSSISENTIFSYNIKSIITREMFESMEYKVGD